MRRVLLKAERVSYAQNTPPGDDIDDGQILPWRCCSSASSCLWPRQQYMHPRRLQPGVESRHGGEGKSLPSFTADLHC